MSIQKHLNQGFTVVELLIVLVVIGLLATVSIVAYNGVQAHTRDVSVLSDIETMDALQTRYGLANNSAGKAWYSGSGVDVDLGFTPSAGNVIDVVISGTAYCIRAYNPDSANYKRINTAATNESSAGACGTLVASTLAQTDSNAVIGAIYWKQISAGWSQTCAISFADKEYCWGSDYSGQLGSNTANTYILVPFPVYTAGVLSGKTMKALSSTGSSQNCAVASDNQAYCWGRNPSGELGNNSTTNSNIAVAVYTAGVLSGKTISTISIGSNHICAIASDSQAYCWGSNFYGELGNNNKINSLVPVAVYTAGALSGKTIKAIAGGRCVIASDDMAYCWGSNIISPVAIDTSGVLSGKTFKAIAAGERTACVIASDNQAYCWGRNDYGQLGNNTYSSTIAPVPPVAVDTSGVLSGKTIKAISTREDHTCVIASDNQVYCWGLNKYGNIGNNNWGGKVLVPTAVDISGVLRGLTIKSMSVGAEHTCVIASDNQAYCWGNNDSGQLGNNGYGQSYHTDSSSQVLVPFLVNSP